MTSNTMKLSPESEVAACLAYSQVVNDFQQDFFRKCAQNWKGEKLLSLLKDTRKRLRDRTRTIPHMASKLSDTEQEPEILSEGTGEKLANTIPDTGEGHPDKWIKGIPLTMVTSGVTLVIFLMLLDMSILSTVCHSTLRVLICF